MKIITAMFVALVALTPLTSALADTAAVGKAAPAFSLTDSNGTKQSLESFKGKFVVLEWTNAGCPFVKKHYSSGNMQRTQEKLTGQGAVWLTINSSATGKQGSLDGAGAKALMTEQGFKSTAYLLDPEGTVGKMYGAKTTPHMFLIDPSGTVVYAGAIDDIATADESDLPHAKNLVVTAFEQAKSGSKVTMAATEPYGCSIKYAS